jgi:Histidine kinase
MKIIVTNILLLVKNDWIWYVVGIIILVILLIISLLRYFIRKSKLQLNSQITELESIINNHHFFYGSLNSIKNYVLSRSPMETAQYLTEFTNLLKTLTSYAKLKNISLAQEIDAVLLYLALEQKRMGDKLEISQEIESGADMSKVLVKPLFAFRQIEELIEQKKTSEKLSILLIIRNLEGKYSCKLEKINSHAKLIIHVPKYSTL